MPALRTSFEPFRLIDGFAAEPMQLQVMEDPFALSWEPVAARFVACAVFSCEPEILDGDGNPLQDQNPREAIIYNFDKCAVRFNQEKAEDGFMRLTSRESYSGAGLTCSDLEMRGMTLSSTRRVFDDLLVGCWAYDEAEIVAASELQRLPPDLLRQYDESYGTCTNNAPCYRGDETATFGICRDGVCQARCTTPADCLLAAKIVDPEAPEPTTCPWDCVPVLSSTAKVCVPVL